MKFTAGSQKNHFISTYRMKHGYSRDQKERVRKELREVGAVYYDLLLPESKSLPYVLDDDENIKGATFGKYESGRGALIATDRRVLFLDKKILYFKFDDIDFDVISAVTLSFVGPYGTVTLHTRLGDYKLKTFNLKAATIFCEYINKQCIEHSVERRRHDSDNAARRVQIN